MKICLACSPGGHMLQIQQLRPIYKKYHHFFLTFKRDMSIDLAKKEQVIFVVDPLRNLAKLVKNIIQSLLIFLKERPDLVIANGGGVVVPFCFFSRIFSKKIIFIESFSRVNKPSLSGKLLSNIVDILIIQWKPLQKFYKKAIYGGCIF